MDVTVNDQIENKLTHRLGEGIKVFGALKSILRGRNVRIEANVCMHRSVVTSLVLHGCETWMLNS